MSIFVSQPGTYDSYFRGYLISGKVVYVHYENDLF